MPAGEFVRILIADSGTGMPADVLSRVFEPFYRPAGHGETGGSWGLGLALVERIAAAHHGSVRCEAGADGGAVFIVDLAAGPG